MDNKNGLIHAYVLDNKGGAKELTFDELCSYEKEMGLLWAHFDYTCEDTIDWITNHSKIDDIAIEALLAEETRPRTTILNDSILLALRGVNLNPNSDPEDMVSIRLFINENIIISTKKRDLLSVNDVVDYLKNKKGPKNSAEFLIDLTDRLTMRMQDTINEMEEKTFYLEELSLSSQNAQLRTEISTLRRESISLQRYLNPQKEAISKLYHNKINWLSEYEKIQLREINDQVIRYTEELETVKDKTTLIQEEFSNKLNEQMNLRVYILSVISAIFLPLGFFTGLLGVNIGGIPGVEDKSAFTIFCIALCVIVVVQIIIFKKKKWI